VVVHTRWIALALLWFACPALADTVAVGEAAPALAVGEWLPEDPEVEGPQLVMFAATWCAASRAVLDRLEPALADRRVVLTVVVGEEAQTVRRFLDVGGWGSVTVGTDVSRDVRQVWFGDDGVGLPFVFVVDADDEGSRRVVYAARAVLPHEPEPLGTLLEVLDAVERGAWDVQAAAVEAQRVADLRHRMTSWRGGYDLGRFEELVDDLEAEDLPVELQPMAVDLLNDIAWSIATTETRPKGLQVGVRAVELAMGWGGDARAEVLDTHARLLWELGEQEEALQRQVEAVALGEGTRHAEVLQGALTQYSEVLGVAVERDDGAEPWSGVINQAFREHPMTAFVLVRPPLLDDEALEGAWAAEMADLHGTIYGAGAVVRADEVDARGRERAVLVLYGTPQDNPLVAEVLAHHHIDLRAEGIQLPDRFVEAPAPFLIAAVPSPWTPSLPVLVYTAWHAQDAQGLNEVFHGPTAVVIGRGTVSVAPPPPAEPVLDELGEEIEPPSPPPPPPAERETALEADLLLDGGRVVGLDLGPAELSSGEAIADLLALHELLRDQYAGYDDIAWELRAQESSWDDRTDAFAEMFSQAEVWTWEVFFDQLVAYLEPVQDTHFRMDGTGTGLEGTVRRRAQLVHSLVPFFADGVYGAYHVSALPLPDASDVVAGVPYLFPTVPRDDQEPAWLLGVFGDPDEPPRFVDLGSPEVPERVPVHRGRVFSGPTDRSWSVSRWPETPLPVLAVRTMNKQRLDGLADSAAGLRDEDTVILDLRDNGGGSDDPAREWVARFSHQWFRWGCGSSLDKAQTDPLRHWTSWADSRFRMGGEGYPSAPFGGRLAVVADNGVASSGETFVFLASQVEGAVLVGENTSGCTAYGNVEEHPPLPHSRIELWFGRSRFVWECVRPVSEGVGIFPDYWLDEPDPVQWLAENPWP